MKKTLFSAAILALLGFTAFSSTNHTVNVSRQQALADTDTVKTPPDTTKKFAINLVNLADTTDTVKTPAPTDTTKKVVLFQ